MKTSLLLAFLLLVTPFLFSNTLDITNTSVITNISVITNTLNVKSIKKQPSISPYFAIVSTMGSVSSVGGGAPNHSVPTLWINLEGIIPVGIKNFYLYTQFRTSFFIGKSTEPFSSLLPIIHMESLKMGFLFGVGGIVGDWRNTDKKGSYVTVNGGFVFEGAYHNALFVSKFTPTKSSLLENFYHIGFEVNSRYHYSFGKYKTMSVGFTVGYLYSPIAGDPFYLGLQRNIVYFHMLNYGFSLGYHF